MASPYNVSITLTCQAVIYCPECKQRLLEEMPADCQLAVVVDCRDGKHRFAFMRDPAAHLMEPGDPVQVL